MKRFILVLTGLFFVLSTQSQTSYTWTNTDGDNNFENPNNWTPTPVFGYPSFGENAVFNGSFSSDDCIIPNDVDFSLLQTVSSYTGTVNASSVALTLVSISHSGGTFAAPSSTLFLSGNLFKASGATYSTSSTSVLEYNLTSTSLRTINGNFMLPTLLVVTTGGGNRFLNFGAATSTCNVLSMNTGTNPMAYRGQMNVNDRLIISGTSTTAATNNTGTVIFIGAGTKTITGTASALQNPIGGFRFNTTGSVTMSGFISPSSTWSVASIGGFIAGNSTLTPSGSPTITAGTTATTRGYFDNIAISANQTLNISGSSQIDLHGGLSNNGRLNTNTSLIRLNASGAQTIGGSSTSTINALDVSNSGTKSINAPVMILDSCGVTGAGTLVSGGNLTLVSTAGQKARIGRIAAGGAVSGAVTVQNFFPGGTTGWANLASPGVAGLTMANWEANFPIVCSGCTYSTVGGQPFESVYWYNETTVSGNAADASHYIPITGPGDPIDEEKGYYVYLGTNQGTTAAITAVLTGTLTQNNSYGGTVLSLTGGAGPENGWNLISNPYPSPISLGRMFSGNLGNIDNSIYVWNADLNGGNGDFSIHTANVGGATDIIPMGQGFFVRTLVNNLTLTGSENWKVSSNVSVEKMNNVNDLNAWFKLNLTGSSKNFNTYAYFDFSNNYTAGFDNGKDVYCLDNATGNLVAQMWSKVNNEKYLASALPFIAPNTSITLPIHISTGYSGVYSISGQNFNALPNMCFELIDPVTQVIHNLMSGPYTTTLAPMNGSTARFNLKVSHCNLVGLPQAAVAGDNSVFIGRDENGVYVDFNFATEKSSRISVCNVLGQKIAEDLSVRTAGEIVSLNIPQKNQLILITVIAEDGTRITKKLIY